MCVRKVAESAAKANDAKNGKNTGRWSIRTSTNAIDDSKIVLVSTNRSVVGSDNYGNSITASVLLRCMENTTSLILNTSEFMSDTQGFGRVDFRVDDKKAQRLNMIGSTDNRALGLWNGRRSIPVIKSMFDGEKLTLRFTPYNENPITATFNIQGVENAVAELRETCNW